ncbi:MAG TPA: valine--tRNA ligase [Saprospiraceae bacterium]|nr:valine--tRNA ligase [Saprospiraceae bacterium]
MSLSSRYTPNEVEEKWYSYWMEKNYFRSIPDAREPYTIVMPPPNITGVLHMGHMLNNTVQDILIRKARLDGKNACWVPGTDHASIATEAKVVHMLRERGIKKSDLSRPEFMQYAFEWKDKYGGIILEQLKKLGASCDWDRTRFTMDESLNKAVIGVFVDLYKKGKIYRGLRMTNWDPEAQTVLSNEEVIFGEENSRLFHVRYQIESTGEFITIATTRPETILGDTAVAVNPADERYKHLKGKRAIVPLIERSVPIIFDRYVEMDFGTGALKVTPAHDTNDYEIGKQHNLETIDIMTPDGKISEAGQLFVGMDRFEARKAIVKELEAKEYIVKIEDYKNKVGRSERSKAVVEPRLTLQWFLDMKDFAAKALAAVQSGEVRFFPEHFINMFKTWLDEGNVKDWCISRQLWWGQQIPAWYFGEHAFVGLTAEDALAEARKQLNDNNIQLEDLRQEEDVVDTWFSSWLWPISVFDGFQDPEELKYYYPTQVLVTAWDIIFFWVARMIMAGYEWSGDLLGKELAERKGVFPFRDVYFTGMVRDNKRQKMSKSLGNSPEALELIAKYGADGVRFGMLSSSAAGNDIIFDAPFDPVTKTIKNESKLCEQGLNFCNKMWNALRLLKGWEIVENSPTKEQAGINELSIKWFNEKINVKLERIESLFNDYKLSECIVDLYVFVWDDFCSWYLEMIKPAYGDPIDRNTYEQTIAIFSKLMTIMHPFMPFVTEEIWHQLKDRAVGEDVIISKLPQKNVDIDQELIKLVETAKDIITKVREARNNSGVKQVEKLALYAQSSNITSKLVNNYDFVNLICKLANLSTFELTETEPENTTSFVSGTEKFYLFIPKTIDIEAERDRISKELEYAKGFVQSIEKKLSNERFVAGAPVDVVEKEKQKINDGLARVKILEESLLNLN